MQTLFIFNVISMYVYTDSIKAIHNSTAETIMTHKSRQLYIILCTTIINL